VSKRTVVCESMFGGVLHIALLAAGVCATVDCGIHWRYS
jgi:hypothetical protein